MDSAVIERYRRAGAIAARARDFGAGLIAEGVKLLDVATQVEEMIRKEGAEPAFPCCISLNQDAAHYTPAVADPRAFSRGDVVKLDVGVHVEGYIGDTAVTVEVGTDREGALLAAAREALAKALEVARPGVAIVEISSAIESAIRSAGLQPVVNLTGHSVDRYHQHAGLSIPNVAATAYGDVPAGSAIAIEPFATRGEGKVKDSGPGHIWHFLEARPQRDPLAKRALQYIEAHHPELPFAERWVAEAIPAAKVPYAMRVLERSRAVRQYPILREAGGGIVAQFEHTLVLTPDGTIVTTKT